MNELLSVQNISKDFNESSHSLSVVQDISFTAHKGEIVCILGASGAGKSTLLNILSGALLPSSGSIVSPFSRPGNKIGYMRQSDDLLPWLNVRRNISLGLDLLHSPKDTISEHTNYWLERIGLKEYANFFPAQLSGGMKQRTALARCLAPRPEILFLDEPLGSLDIVGRRKMAEYIKHYITDEQACGIVVTHSVEEAIFLADKILIMTPRPMSIAAEIHIHDDDTNKGGLLRSQAFDTIASTLFSVTQEKEEEHA